MTTEVETYTVTRYAYRFEWELAAEDPVEFVERLTGYGGVGWRVISFQFDTPKRPGLACIMERTFTEEIEAF